MRPAVAFAALVLAGCTSSPPSPIPSPSAAASPSSPQPASSETSSLPSVGAVVLDESLLEVLPTAVDGAALSTVPDAADLVDQSLAADVSAMAYAIALDPASGDQVVAVVAAMRRGRFDEEFFRDWRDSFDEGVCERAGGIAGKAESEIGGRATFIGTCAQSVITYHTHLEDGDLIVSAQALGAGRFGERLMETLRPWRRDRRRP